MATVRSVTHRLLQRHGVTTIFGNPGSNELPFLKDLPGEMSYYLGLHEGVVVGMADGYAQASGRTPLVNLHAAAGTGNAMGALTNAVYSRTPLVLTAGQQVRAVVGMEAMLANVDAARLTEPLVGWSAEPLCAADVPRTISQALLHAQRPPHRGLRLGPLRRLGRRGRRCGPARHPRGPRGGPPVDGRRRLAGRRRDPGQRPVLVLGGDVDRACQFGSAVALAERLDCPVWAAPSLWRLPFPNRHRLFRGRPARGHRLDLTRLAGPRPGAGDRRAGVSLPPARARRLPAARHPADPGDRRASARQPERRWGRPSSRTWPPCSRPCCTAYRTEPTARPQPTAYRPGPAPLPERRRPPPTHPRPSLPRCATPCRPTRHTSSSRPPRTPPGGTRWTCATRAPTTSLPREASASVCRPRSASDSPHHSDASSASSATGPRTTGSPPCGAPPDTACR